MFCAHDVPQQDARYQHYMWNLKLIVIRWERILRVASTIASRA
jgi:hypothetical protein